MIDSKAAGIIVAQALVSIVFDRKTVTIAEADAWTESSSVEELDFLLGRFLDSVEQSIIRSIPPSERKAN